MRFNTDELFGFSMTEEIVPPIFLFMTDFERFIDI